MSQSTSGLVLFVVVVVLNVLALALDTMLLKLGLPTITSIVRTYPTLGYVILLVQGAGALGLADHFTKGKP